MTLSGAPASLGRKACRWCRYSFKYVRLRGISLFSHQRILQQGDDFLTTSDVALLLVVEGDYKEIQAHCG